MNEKPQGGASLQKHLPSANPDVKEAAVKLSSSAFPPQMTSSNSNLTTTDITERSGNDDVAIQEPLFDKLIKKALAYVFK